MKKVDYISGCALMMHISVPRMIGLLDERFFLLWEESDFCARARRAGFEIWTAPKAKIWHKVSASFTGGKPHMHYFWWRNRLLFIQNNCNPKEKRKLYSSVIIPEITKTIKLTFLKTAEIFFLKSLFRPNPAKEQKARRYRAGARGIFHYFLGRFGNGPNRLFKR